MRKRNRSRVSQQEETTMEMIRIYNRKSGEILEKTFTHPKDADNYEVILDFLTAEYERYHDGEMICASKEKKSLC